MLPLASTTNHAFRFVSSSYSFTKYLSVLPKSASRSGGSRRRGRTAVLGELDREPLERAAVNAGEVAFDHLPGEER